MNDAARIAIGTGGTAFAFIGAKLHELLTWIGPHAPTLAGLATAFFMLASVAEKFGLLDRFRRKPPKP